MIGDDRDVLEEQIEYYRARANEYDDSYERRGRHDHGPEANAAWFSELREVADALEHLPLDGADVLELAAGTGVWTGRLARRASRVVAVDTAPEMLERNRARLGPLAAKVDYVRADLFSWQPTHAFDAVVFCFWLSHVPAERLDAFLNDVAQMIRPAGWVFFADSQRRSTSLGRGEHPDQPGVEIRRLDDRSEWRVVKHVWPDSRLRAWFRRFGLDVDVRHTATHFQYGIGQRRQIV